MHILCFILFQYIPLFAINSVYLSTMYIELMYRRHYTVLFQQ